MKLPQDETFRVEARRFGLKWCCEDCTRFDPAHETCAHGYPSERHRKGRYADPRVDLLFCKEFELA